MTMVLFGFLFASPLGLLLAAAGAVSVPIIIHLLNRKRFRVVDWAAMRFLLAAQRKNSRKMRIEQLILLIIRCLIVLLVALAMAAVTDWVQAGFQALFPGAAAYTDALPRTHKVFVIDGSLSMATRLDNGDRFGRARALAEQIVRDSPPGDAFSVVLMASSPRRVVNEASEDADRVVAEMQALRLPHGNADLLGALTAVEDVLKQSPGKFAHREVYFLTDMQAATWVGDILPSPDATGTSTSPAFTAALQKIQDRARTVFVDVGQEVGSNLAVTRLGLNSPIATTTNVTPITMAVHHYGPDARSKVLVKLLVGKVRAAANDPPFEMRVVQDTELQLSRGSNTYTFPYKVTSPGEYGILVRLGDDNQPTDESSPDDVRSAVVTVKDHVPVMLVNGKQGAVRPGGKLADEATEWLRLALNPDGDKVTPGPLPTKPKVVGEKEFADAGLGDLTPYDCVYLCDVKQLTPPEVRRLETHVRQGGGVIVCVGDQVDVRAYNDLLYRNGLGLLPAKLAGKQSAPGNTYFHFAVNEKAYLSPPLNAFASDDDRSGLENTRFRHYLRTESLAKGARKVISFMPGSSAPPGTPPSPELEKLPINDAAVIDWLPLLSPAGRDEANAAAPRLRARGRVLLVTTAVNMDWSTWPAYRSYLPLMKELLAFAVSGRLREQSRTVGDPLEEYLPITGGGLSVSVQTPDDRPLGTIQTQEHDEVSLFRWHDTDVSGVYRATVGQHPREYAFAVNVPTANEGQEGSESDPARTTLDEMKRAYPLWDFQLVTDPRDVKHAALEQAGVVDDRDYLQSREHKEKVERLCRAIAWGLVGFVALLLLVEVVLAWVFGHYSASAGTPGQTSTGWLLPVVAAAFAGLVVAGMAVVGLHFLATQDFMSFLGEWPRRMIEEAHEIPPAAPGEDIRWQAQTDPLWGGVIPGLGLADPWLARLLGVVFAGLIFVWLILKGPRSRPLKWSLLLGLPFVAVAICLVAGYWPAAAVVMALCLPVAWIYMKEGQTAAPAYKWLLVGLRAVVLLLVFLVLLAQLRAKFDLRSWPDVAIIIDDSQSMSVVDEYRDAVVKEAVDRVARENGLTQQDRLALARALVGGKNGYLERLVTENHVKVHLFHCSSKVDRLAEVMRPEQIDPAREQVAGLVAEPTHDASRLGSAVRKVIDGFKGRPLAAVVLVSDGVTTEGEDLVKVSAYARLADVPLFLVGIGDSHEPRDLYLHDLQCDDSVYTNDRIVFEVRLTGQGYGDLTVPVRLREKGKEDKILKEERVAIDPSGKPVKVRLLHQPTEPGEKTFIIDVPVQADETHPDNNRLERTVFVRDAKLFKVLYVEGYARYEYRYIKTLLERESARQPGNKSIDLKVLLLDADPDFASTDKSSLVEFPARTELNGYDVIVLGDVDPKHPKLGDKAMGDLADFVRDNGGGLLVMAGDRHSPYQFKTSPLADVLPIEILRTPPPEDAATPRPNGYRAELTPGGRLHPIFRFDPSEKENEDIWNRLREMYWWTEGYRAKPAAEVLAVHPKVKLRPEDRPPSGDDGLPLVVQHFVGSGRCLFFGFQETWRWRFREDEQRFNQFWVQTIRHLARSRLGRVELRVDKQTPYQRGEPIKVTVRFPDDQAPPDANAEVKVIVERRPPRKPGTPVEKTHAGPPLEVQTLSLTRTEASKMAFEGLLTRTPEGEYQFWLSVPVVTGPKPRAEARVLAPPGEMELLRMNQADMERAAEESQGHFYTLAEADRLPNDLPPGHRVSLNPNGPSWLVWNNPLIFLVVLGLLTFEWVLRKMRHLL